MPEVDVGIVTYRPDLPQLRRLLASLVDPLVAVDLRIQDNSEDPGIAETIAALAQAPSGGAFRSVDIRRSGANLGFGRGQNAALARGRAPFALVLNQDCVLEPGTLGPLLDAAAASPSTSPRGSCGSFRTSIRRRTTP
jgi:Predicted glycosyltransferases